MGLKPRLRKAAGKLYSINKTINPNNSLIKKNQIGGYKIRFHVFYRYKPFINLIKLIYEQI